MNNPMITVACKADIPLGQTRKITLNGRVILLANVEGTIYAVDDTCTHEDSSLALGCLKGFLVSCTLHGSRFDVRTGVPVEKPATEALRRYHVEVVGDEVRVDPRSFL